MDLESLQVEWSRAFSTLGSLDKLSAAATYRPFAARDSAIQRLLPRADERYEIKQELGRGGMGIVYSARQVALDRDVAVKILRAADEPGTGTGASCAASSFLAEALTNGLLEHPNIVPAYDLDRTEKGELFLAMKKVGGLSWDRHVVAGKLGLRDHLEILIQVCNAVSYAHSRDVLHNDLKPSNVMIGEFGEVLVMDWGLAVEFGRRRPGSALRHKADVQGPCGTPQYMAPELAEGRGAGLGPWTDIYLLGGILYRLLSGHPPHHGENALEALIRAVTHEIEPLDSKLPAELRAICERALQLDPAARHPDVASFQAELQRFLRHGESLRISAAAEQTLKQAQASSSEQLGKQARNALYARYAEAVAGFGQARQLWEENPQAADGVELARLAYAGAALSQGDLGLAEAQLALLPDSASVGALRTQAQGARALRWKERRAQRRTRALLLGSVLLLVVGLSAGLLFFWQQNTLILSQNQQLHEGKALVSRQLEQLQISERAREQREELAMAALEELTDLPLAWMERGDRAAHALGSEALRRALAGWRALERLGAGGARSRLGQARAQLRVGRILLKLDADVEAAAEEFSQVMLLTALGGGAEDSLRLALRESAVQELAMCRLRAGDVSGYLEALQRKQPGAQLDVEAALSARTLRRFRPLLEGRARLGDAEYRSLRLELDQLQHKLLDLELGNPDDERRRWIQLLAVCQVLQRIDPPECWQVVQRVRSGFAGLWDGTRTDALGLLWTISSLTAIEVAPAESQEPIWQELAALASQLLEPLGDDQRETLVDRQRRLGIAFGDKGRWREADALFAAAVALCRSAHDRDPSSFTAREELAAALSWQARSQRGLQQLHAGVALGREALALFDGCLAEAPDDMLIRANRAVVCEDLGQCYGKLGQWDASIEQLHLALAFHERLERLGPEESAAYQSEQMLEEAGWFLLWFDPGSFSSREQQARICSLLGDRLHNRDPERAAELYRRAIRLRWALVEEDPGNLDIARRASSLGDILGHLLEEVGDATGALEAYQQGHLGLRRLAGQLPGDRGLKEHCVHMAQHVSSLLGEQGEAAKALPVISEALLMLRALHDGASPAEQWQRKGEIASLLGDRALLYVQSDRLVEARQGLEEAAQLQRRVVGWDAGASPGLFVRLWQLGRFQAELGELDAARGHLEECLELAERFSGAFPQDSGPLHGYCDVLFELVAVLEAQRDVPALVARLEEGLVAAERLLALVPTDKDVAGFQPRLLRLLGVAHRAAGELATARELLEAAQELWPGQETARSHALLELLAGNPARARGDLQHLADQSHAPEDALWLAAVAGDPVRLLGLDDPGQGWTAELCRFFRGGIAADQLLRAAARAPKEAERRRRRCEARIFLGLHAAQQGDSAQARLHYQRAQELPVPGLELYGCLPQLLELLED